MDKIRELFDSLPSALKVIIYSGMSAIIAQIGVDIAGINSVWVAYLTIILTVATNIISYLILRVKE